MFFRFHIAFWTNLYEVNDKFYYLLNSKNITNESVNEDKSSQKKISFELKERNNSKILQNFMGQKNISKWDNLYVLLATLLFQPDTVFIIWGIILNLIYIQTNSPILIILQIASVYNFTAFVRLFVKVIKDKFVSFFILLMLTWFIQYIFMWIGFLHLQDILIGEFRYFKKDGYEYDDDVKNKLILLF
jgi:hypothetical protein